MRILTRYLLRAHLGPFVFALSVLTGLLFVNTVAKRFPSLAGKGLPAEIILKVMGLSLPHIIALTLPMAVLVAVLYAYSQMTADNEITAIKASGASLLRMMVPLIVTAALLSAVMVWFNDRVLPETNHKLAELMMDINTTSPTLTMKDRGVLNEIPTVDYSTHYWLKAQRIDVATNRLTDVVIYDVSNPDISQTVIADSGQMVFNRDRTKLFLTLYHGRVDQIKRLTPRDMDRVFFQQQNVQLQVANQFTQTTDNYRSDREMSLDMLKARMDTASMELAAVKAGITPVGDTARLYQQGFPTKGGIAGHAGPVSEAERQERIKSLQSQVNSYAVEWHKKFAIPFACIIFVLIGAPIAVRFPRGGAGMVIAISLLIFGIYYVSLIGGESLGDKGQIPSFLGPWAPNFLFGLIGLIATLRIGREMSTSRGGGWDDLRATMISFVTSPFRKKRT